MHSDCARRGQFKVDEEKVRNIKLMKQTRYVNQMKCDQGDGLSSPMVNCCWMVIKGYFHVDFRPPIIVAGRR